MYTIYGATKVFDRYLSIGLAREYKNKNIDVLSVCPGFTRTPMTRNVKGLNKNLEIEAWECSEGTLR